MLNSPIKYSGGKCRLAKHIIALIPKHVCYVEPFCGAAWVLFKKEPSKTEIINDLDNELVNFWRVIQNHFEVFIDYFKFAIVSRKIFELENKINPDSLTDIQRAIRYYYLQRLTFAGKTDGRTFGIKTIGYPDLNISTLKDAISQAHQRLAHVVIEHMDACKCIQTYDRPYSFFYIDPPYWNVSKCYANNFTDDDFSRLRSTLDTVKGKFILSINDIPKARQKFKGFKMISIQTKYSSGNPHVAKDTHSKPRRELLILNYNPK